MNSLRKKRGTHKSVIPRYLRRKGIMLLAGLILTAVGAHWSKGRVIQVADGDTFTLHTEIGRADTVRLYGIDAPETGQRDGDAATGFAGDMLLFSPVSLSVLDTDQYGRSVALVRLEDGRLVNEEMVRAGRAWVYRAYCREAICAKWLALEYQARKQGLGLWRHDNPVPPWQWRKANRRR